MGTKVTRIEIKVTRTMIIVLAGLLLVTLALLAMPSAGAHPPLEGPGGQGEVTVASTVPTMISYQGQLLDSGGNLVPDGTYTMTFKLYNVASGGTALWEETHPSVEVTDGLFNVLLGEYLSLITPDGEIYPYDPGWLGVTVGSDPEMTPRQRMVSVPFAFQAKTDNDWDGACTGMMYTHCLTDNVGIGTTDPQGLLQVGEGTFIVTSPENYIGINDLTPDAKLEVSVDGQAIPDLFMLSSDDNEDGDRFIVKNNGNVGIGTQTPSDKLHVFTTDAEEKITIETTDANGVTSLHFRDNKSDAEIRWIGEEGPTDRLGFFLDYWGSGIDQNEYLTILDTGNVGIGTTSPTEKLDVNGKVRVGDLPLDNNLNDIVVADTSGVLHTRNASTLGEADDDWYGVATGNPPTSILDDIYTHGKVGIGTAVPQTDLHVAASSDQSVRINGAGRITIHAPSGMTAAYLAAIDGINTWGMGKTLTIDNDFHIYNYPSSRTDLTILDSSGNVGIGTTSPQAKLDVAGATTLATGGQHSTWIGGDPAGPTNADVRILSQGYYYSLAASNANNTENYFSIKSGSGDAYFKGNVGIGTTSPQAKLDVAGATTLATGSQYPTWIGGSPASLTNADVRILSQGYVYSLAAGNADNTENYFTITNGSGDGYFKGDVLVGGDLQVIGNKNFVQAHPTDPTKEIVYVSLEGPEAGTYIRGTAQLVDGEAVISLPEHFSLVTSDEGLTVQLTPVGEWLQLYVVEKGTQRVIIREANGKNGQFDYLVQGVRKGYEDHQVIREKEERR